MSAPGPGSAPQGGRGGIFWISFVVVLLAAVVIGNVALLRVASSDPSVAVEPDYYRKAADWDASAAARDRSGRLGWTAGVSARPGDGGADLVVRLTDRSGAAVTGALLDVEAFAVARSADRLTAAGTTGEAGEAVMSLPHARAGLWEVRLSARRGDDAFVATRRVDVPGVAPP